MKLVPKLTAAFIAGTVVVLAANGYFRIRRDTARLHADRLQSHALVGRALGAAVSAVWRSDGRADALRVIQGADEHEGALRIKWLDAAAVPAQARVEGDALATLPAGETLTRIVRTPSGAQRFSYTAVSVGREGVGFVELSETLEAEHRAVQTIETDTLLTTLTLILVCGALAAGLGLWLVGRPVQVLCAQARRIGDSDFAHPLAVTQKDELGLLATEMNAMCDRLVKATDRVERETAARIATLEQLRHVDRLTTVGTLAAGVAHELGTPLNVVSARAKMIASGKTTPKETTEYARIIAAAADRMTNIIRHLLAFARRKPTSKSPHDLRRIASDTIDLLRPMAESANVRFGLSDATVPAMAEVDGDAIQQVLTNIFVNAIHAMPQGGLVDVEISSETRSGGRDHPGRHLLIRARDEGEGIAPGDLPHIFEPFFTTKEVGRGTGLGLSVTHGIVEDHGGFMDVESVLGKGTTVSVHLPAVETH